MFTLLVNCFLLGICENVWVSPPQKSRNSNKTHDATYYQCLVQLFFQKGLRRTLSKESLFLLKRESLFFPIIHGNYLLHVVVGIMNFMRIGNLFIVFWEKQEVIAWYMIVEIWCIMIALPLYYLGITMSIRILHRHDL